jgi:Flp pilus assembly protein TadG
MDLALAKRTRSGATLVEAAIVIPIVLALTVGMLDLSIVVFRNNLLAQAAREGARKAIVHGSLATPQMTVWGPSTFTATADDSGEIAQAIAPHLTSMNPANVNIQVQWLDGNNEPDSQVRVTVTATYQPFTTFIFGNPTFNLSGSSTMRIAH